MGAVALDLLVAGDGAEDDLGEALAGEGPEADAANWSSVLYKGQGLVFGVEHLQFNIIFW